MELILGPRVCGPPFNDHTAQFRVTLNDHKRFRSLNLIFDLNIHQTVRSWSWRQIDFSIITPFSGWKTSDRGTSIIRTVTLQPPYFTIMQVIMFSIPSQADFSRLNRNDTSLAAKMKTLLEMVEYRWRWQWSTQVCNSLSDWPILYNHYDFNVYNHHWNFSDVKRTI